MFRILEESKQLTELNEMFINVLPTLPKDVESSIYYTRIKNLLHPEIFDFCKEYSELKADLNFFRMNVGGVMTEYEIREYLDSLKNKYNNDNNSRIAIEYHIEITRVDYGVPVFCVLRRGNEIRIKKFTFRFRKTNSDGISGLSVGQIPIKNNMKNGGEE